jgi:predicted N-acyltransferase
LADQPTLRATIHPSTASIPAAAWNALAPSTDGQVDNPFLDHAFFAALEDSGCASRSISCSATTQASRWA